MQKQADDSDLRGYMARTLREEPLSYDADGRPRLSRRAIRHGLAVSAVFYGIVLCIIGAGYWAARHFL
jgi:hypothetical protein